MAMLMPGEMGGMPGEYGMTRQKSDRKRKLAEALRQEAVAPQGRMVGNTFVAPSITQYLASGLKGYQANEMERTADAEEKAIFDAKQKQMTDAQAAYMNALRPQQVQTGVAKQPFEPGQMDQFGSPMPGQQQTTQPVMGTKQPSIQDLYAAQMQYAQATQNPELMMNAGNSIAQYQDKQQTRQEDRDNKLFDVQDQRKYENIVRKEDQGFQLTRDEQNFKQQVQIQSQNQGFQAGENAKNRNFQAGQNDLSRANALAAAAAKVAPKNKGLSVTAQKELIDAEDSIQGSREALKDFGKALKLNDKAMGGFGAGALATAGTVLPDFARPATVDATKELDNVLQNSALPQLKAIFGGMPTEGERAILLEVQGSSAQPASVRKGIFERAQKAAENRIKYNTEKAKQLRNGTYFTEEGGINIQDEAPAANGGWSIKPL
jgi:hypothetical protein